MFDDGDAETMIGKRRDVSPRQCDSKRLTEILKTPHAKTEQVITTLAYFRYFLKNPKNNCH